MTYAALTLAHLGLNVRALVGADAEAAAAAELDALRDAGVDLRVASLRRGPVLVNDERASGRVQLAVEVADLIPVAALPPGWANADAVFFGPIAGELGPEWAAVTPGTVALGWQGLLRRLEPGQPVARLGPTSHPLVAAADLVGVSADDLLAAAHPRQLVDLIRPGATVVITRGLRGGTALTSRRPARAAVHSFHAVPSDRIVDPTGAGDVFLAAVLAAILAGPELEVAEDWPSRLQFGAAAASLVIEGPGLTAVPTLEAVRRRERRVPAS